MLRIKATFARHHRPQNARVLFAMATHAFCQPTRACSCNSQLDVGSSRLTASLLRTCAPISWSPLPGVLSLAPIASLKESREDGSIIEIVVWLVPEEVPPSTHSYKYGLYFGKDGGSRVRFDNERGKGDHKHLGEFEQDYRFHSLEQLLADFRSDVDNWS